MMSGFHRFDHGVIASFHRAEYVASCYTRVRQEEEEAITTVCRLLGYATASPVAVRDALGEAAFDRFTELSRLHRDGWGMAWSDYSGVHRAAAPVPAVENAEYRQLARAELGTAGIVHLRWATDGLTVAPENTHPFLVEGIALAHNGSIGPIPHLEELLTPESRAALIGTTDSERYLRLVVDRTHLTGNPVDGVRSAVVTLLERFHDSSMNAMILTEDHLFAVHASHTAPPPLEDLLELYADPSRAPLDHFSAYFQLRYRVQPGAVLIASTGIVEDGWIDVPQNTLLVVDRADLSTHLFSLSPAGFVA